MNRCPVCSAPSKPEAKFCGRCGASLDVSAIQLRAQVEVLQKRIEDDPLDPSLHIELGAVYERHERHGEALLEYEKAVQLDATLADGHVGVATALLHLDHVPEAGAAFARALKLAPESIRARTGLLVCDAARGADPAAVIHAGEAILRDDPENVEAHRVLAALYAKRRMTAEYVKVATFLADRSPDDQELQVGLADAHYGLGDFAKARSIYETVLATDPDHGHVRLGLGRCCRELGDYPAATVALTPLLEDRVSDPDERAIGLCLLALANLSQERWDEAIAAAERITPQERDSSGSTEADRLAEMYQRLGDHSLAAGYPVAAARYLVQAKSYSRDPKTLDAALASAESQMASEKSRRRRRQMRALILVACLAGLVAAGLFTLRGRILVEIRPVGDYRVLVDGRLVATQPAAGGEDEYTARMTSWLRMGDHNVTIEREDHRPWEGRVRLALSRTVVVRADLVSRYGTLNLTTHPAGASVHADGRRIGETPLASARLLGGQYGLIVSEPRHKTIDTTVVIPESGTLDLEFTLELSQEERQRVAGQEAEVRLRAEREAQIEADAEKARLEADRNREKRAEQDRLEAKKRALELKSAGHSGFDGAGLDGWTPYQMAMENPGNGGSGGGTANGCLVVTQDKGGATGYFIAPTAYHGDWGGVSELQMDLRSSGGKYFSSGYGMVGDVAIYNGSRCAWRLLPNRPPGSWQKFVVPLVDDGKWHYGGGATRLSDVLSHVTDFRIRAEYGVGTDECGLDNVGLIWRD